MRKEWQDIANRALDRNLPAPAVPSFPRDGGTVSEAERRTPSRVPSPPSDVLVPLFRSLLTGGLVGLPAGITAAVAWHWPWWVPVVTTFGTISLSWLIFLSHSDKSLWVIEKLVNRDLTGDKQVGQPEPVTVQAEVTYLDELGKKRRMQYADVFPKSVLEVTPVENIREFIQSALEGEPLTEERWTGSGQPFGLRAYRKLMRTLEQGNLVERISEASNSSRQLSLTGRAVFRRMLTHGLQ